MGRGIPALLGLCCLLAGALCPGLAQVLFPSGSAGGMSEAPPDLSVLPTSGEGVTAEPEEQTWAVGLAEGQSVTLSPAAGETGGVTERSVFGADDVDPVSASAHPGSASAHPGSVSAHPGSASAHPGSVSAHPGSVSAHPGSASAHPGSVSAHPGSASEVGTESSDEAISGSAETTTSLSRTFPEQDDTGREMTSPDNSAFTPTATSTAIPTITPTAPSREEQTAEATDIPSASPLATSPEPPGGQSEAAQPSPEQQPTWMAAITTNAFLTSTASSTIPATQGTAPTKTSPSEVQEQPSVLDVGEKDLPKFYSGGKSNLLFVIIISIFTIMAVLVVMVLGFHRYQLRKRRTEFRRLQDLPMDDMMEDTPLSLYSY